MPKPHCCHVPGPTGARRRLAGVAAALAAGLLCVTAAPEQLARLMLADTAIEEQPGHEPGFMVPQAEEEVLDALTDFRRHLDAEQWEKAFGVMDQVMAADKGALLPRADGLYLPIRQQVWDALASLPASGRSAVQLFFDGKAKKTLESAQDPAMVGSDAELEALEQVYHEYFITSVGDTAADRLGDLYFERGRFTEARRCWDAVLEHHPDSPIDPRMLRVKSATATLRAGYDDEFAQMAKVLSTRYAGQAITIAGNAVDIDTHLAELGKTVGQARPADHNQPGDAKQWTLPAEDQDPAWQCAFLSPVGKRQAAAVMAQAYIANSGIGLLGPRTVIQGDRLYANWIGVVFAIDLVTGKLLWRSESFSSVASQFQNIGQSGTFEAQQYGVRIVGDKLLTVSTPPNEATGWNNPYRLMAYDLSTGRLAWNTASQSDLQQVSFLGDPAVMGDLAIAYTAQPGNAAVTLRAIRLADGTEAWSVPLGTAQMVYNARGSQVVPVPRLIAQREMLYIMTNNGGLLAFDTEARQLSWALRYDIPGGAALVNQHRGYNTTNVTLPHAGDLLIANGLVLVKEARSREMRAIDLGTRQVAWERPLSTHARLAAQDEKRFYFFDPQLVAIDKGNEQRMKWSVQLPKGSSSTGLVDLGDSFAVFTSRGVFAYSKANGDRVHKFPGHDRDSWGGDVFVHDGKLITVSNQAITAYPLSPAIAEAKEAQP